LQIYNQSNPLRQYGIQITALPQYGALFATAVVLEWNSATDSVTTPESTIIKSNDIYVLMIESLPLVQCIPGLHRGVQAGLGCGGVGFS
jgi:hypothetical protein